MITLKESLLDKTRDKVRVSKETIANLEMLGGKFMVRPDSVYAMSNRNLEKMSAINLKKCFPKDLHLDIDDKYLDLSLPKSIQLCKYLYSLSIDDFDAKSWDDVLYNDADRKRFESQLENKMKKDAIWKNSDYYVYVKSYKEGQDVGLRLDFCRNDDKWSHFVINFILR